MNNWDLASVLAKVVYLAAMAAPVGGAFSLYLGPRLNARMRHHVLLYIFWAALLGVLANSLFFLFQIGAINQRGLAGMWDWRMGSILAMTGLGHAAGLRMLGYLFAIVMVVLCWRRNIRDPGGAGIPAWDAYIVVLALFGLSFPLAGHAAGLEMVARGAVIVHALAVFLWIGSLYPLWYFCREEPVEVLRDIMSRFGRFAAWIVAFLIAAGTFLLIRLLDSFAQLIDTPYGLGMLLKLLLVAGLLALAALNRFILVPGLAREGGVYRLRRAIGVEMILAVLILSVTAWLATAAGVS